MKKITSRDNPYIKHALSLKNKKYRAREQMFLLEGEKMVIEALEKGMPLVRVMINEDNRQEYEAVAEQYGHIEWLEVNSRIFKKMADTETPQGIMAVALIPSRDFSELLNQAACLLLLDQISDPGNLGTIIRTAWALDMEGILLGEGCTEPYSPKTVRSSMGGIFEAPVYTGVGLPEIERLKAVGYRVIGTSVTAEDTVFDTDYRGSSIIVIGSEARGISPAIRSLCDKFITIPINPAVDSLNAAVSCAIIMMEIWKQRHGVYLS